MFPEIQNWFTAEIIKIQGEPITLKAIFLAIMTLILGLVVAKYFSRLFVRRVVVRFQSDLSIQYTVQTLMFYLLATIVLLLSLSIAHIPLTIFTVAGGALAIGIGFGSQNILNNFISGLILMFERPLKVGDHVEIQGTYGVVERIGFRSTQILSFGNLHMIFPNSSFLEKDFINWTLRDEYARIKVGVGVAYGSPTRKVRELLLKAVDEHPRALSSIPPKVLFQEFGDNSLVFEVYFSIELRELADPKVIASDIRFRVDDLFREAGITIAFPQRDVHLDSLKPIEVQLVNNKNG